MDLKTFLPSIEVSPEDTRSYFRQLEQAILRNEDTTTLWPWLRLIRNDVLYNWARADGEFQGYAKLDYSLVARQYKPLVEELLRRFVLHLGHRENPEPLKKYWQWLLRCYGHETDGSVWDRLPDTLNAPSIKVQEEGFADVLDLAAEEAGGIEWIADYLSDLANQRRAPGDPGANRPEVRIVFGMKGEPGPRLRRGTLIPFELGGCDSSCEIERADLFDGNFLKSVRLARAHIGDTWLLLTHDWDFLQPEPEHHPSANHAVFEDGSGAMAIRVAQYLFQGGHLQDGRRWTLAPWAVISAAHDREGNAACGTWSAVELLDRKSEVLIEEGIRVLVTPSEGVKGTEQTAAQFFEARDTPAPPGSHLLFVPEIRRTDGRGESHFFLADKMRDLGYAQPLNVDFDSSATRDFRHVSKLPSHHYSSRVNRITKLQLDEYEPPDYLYAELQKKINELLEKRGKGYVLWSAPSGLGKTTLMMKPQHYWPEEFGAVISHPVLPGRPEHALELCKTICFASPDISYGNVPQETSTAAEARFRLREMLKKFLKDFEIEPDRAQKRLLLAIDGVNYVQADWGSPCTLFDILPAPDELPDGCFVLLSTVDSDLERIERELCTAWKRARAPVPDEPYLLIESQADADGNRQLLTRYLKKQLRAEWHPHIDTLIDNAEQRFLYASLYADYLHDTTPEAAPAGALSNGDELWQNFLDKLSKTVKAGPTRDWPQERRFEDWHQQIICLLAAAQEPVGVDHLQLWLDHHPAYGESRHQLLLALEEMHRLVRSQFQGDDFLITLAHDEFRNWLDESPNWSERVRNCGHDRIAKSWHQQQRQTWPTACGAYFELHALTHLMAVQEWDAAWSILRDFRPETPTDAVPIIATRASRSDTVIGALLSIRRSQLRTIFQHMLTEGTLNDAWKCCERLAGTCISLNVICDKHADQHWRVPLSDLIQDVRVVGNVLLRQVSVQASENLSTQLPHFESAVDLSQMLTKELLVQIAHYSNDRAHLPPHWNTRSTRAFTADNTISHASDAVHYLQRAQHALRLTIGITYCSFRLATYARSSLTSEDRHRLRLGYIHRHARSWFDLSLLNHQKLRRALLPPPPSMASSIFPSILNAAQLDISSIWPFWSSAILAPCYWALGCLSVGLSIERDLRIPEEVQTLIYGRTFMDIQPGDIRARYSDGQALLDVNALCVPGTESELRSVAVFVDEFFSDPQVIQHIGRFTDWAAIASEVWKEIGYCEFFWAAARQVSESASPESSSRNGSFDRAIKCYEHSIECRRAGADQYDRTDVCDTLRRLTTLPLSPQRQMHFLNRLVDEVLQHDANGKVRFDGTIGDLRYVFYGLIVSIGTAGARGDLGTLMRNLCEAMRLILEIFRDANEKEVFNGQFKDLVAVQPSIAAAWHFVNDVISGADQPGASIFDCDLSVVDIPTFDDRDWFTWHEIGRELGSLSNDQRDICATWYATIKNTDRMGKTSDRTPEDNTRSDAVSTGTIRSELCGLSPGRRRRAGKVGRNDPCPCGSGKKYKKCCGAPK